MPRVKPRQLQIKQNQIRVAVNNSRNNWSRVVEIEAYRSDCSAPPTNIAPTTYAYDSAYRLISVTDAANHTTSFGYDAMSNQTSVTDALGRVTDYEYDDFNRLKKVIYPPATSGATRLFETISYDGAGNVTQRTDTAGRVTSYAYDNVDRITSTTDADNKTTSFQYDALSRVTAVTDAISQQYQFAYDALGRQTSMTRAGLTMSYQYDAVGNRTRRTDYNGAITNYTFDDVNRPTTISYPDSTNTTFGYDVLSRISSATNANGTVSFSYDNRGRVASTTDVFNQTVGYSYDANSNRAAMTLNGAANASYTHDAVNRMTQLRDATNLSFTFAYDAVNRLTNRNAPNGVIATFGYDGLDRLTGLTHVRGTTTIASNQYQFNNANNIASWTNPAGNHAYGYDAVDRLTSAANSVQPNENYSYDGVGNRTASHLSASYSYQPFNKLTSTTGATYSYDNNGNLTSKTNNTGTTEFAWDFENRLKQVTLPNGNIVTYKYDALGRRIERSAGLPPPLPPTTTTRFIYDGADVIRDTNAAGVSTANYLNGPGIDNKLRQSVGVTGLYFLQDHLGSTQALTDGNGNIVEQQQYDSFGNSAGSNLTRYGYTGRERDPDTALLYYRARSYDPQFGRFLSEDPIGFHGGTNWYAYVGNNPAKYTDPSGLWAPEAHDFILEEAFKNCLTDSQIKQLKDGSRYVDRLDNLDEAHAYQHSQRAPWETVDEASRNATTFMWLHESSSRRLAPRGCQDGPGKIPPQALYELGQAMHTTMDHTSPAHNGFQVYHGPPYPTPLTPYDVYRYHRWLDSITQHAAQETLAKLKADQFRLNWTKQLVRAQFKKVFGNCGCCTD